MSVGTELLAKVEAVGARAKAVNGKIRVRTPNPLPDDLRESLRKHKEEVLAVLERLEPHPLTPEVLYRVRVFHDQLNQRPRPVPFFCLPDMIPQFGTCLSCGNELPQGNKIRCGLCVRAAHIVLEV